MKTLSILIILIALCGSARGNNATNDVPNVDLTEIMAPLIGNPNDFDPNDPNYERYYDDKTGTPLDNVDTEEEYNKQTLGCYRSSCGVWAYVSITTQRLYLYEYGQQIATWKVSTGLYGPTRTGDFRPKRVYDYWDSTRYPDGDYNGLGNMPYAVFYYGGFAIHGTTRGNWSRLGHPASHGCVRLHPDNAYTFNRMVRRYGLSNSWITVTY